MNLCHVNAKHALHIITYSRKYVETSKEKEIASWKFILETRKKGTEKRIICLTSVKEAERNFYFLSVDKFQGAFALFVLPFLHMNVHHNKLESRKNIKSRNENASSLKFLFFLGRRDVCIKICHLCWYIAMIYAWN